MSFVKSMFGNKKGRGREDFTDSGRSSPGLNGSPAGVKSSPGGVRKSPSGGVRGSPGGVRKSPAGGGAVATSKSRDSSSPKRSPKKPAAPSAQHQASPQSNGKDMGDPTEEEIEAMNLPFKERAANKRDRNLSISRSGRHKYKNKQRMSLLTQDVYSDIPADQNQDPPSTGASGGGSRQFQSHQRPALSISGASAAV